MLLYYTYSRQIYYSQVAFTRSDNTADTWILWWLYDRTTYCNTINNYWY